MLKQLSGLCLSVNTVADDGHFVVLLLESLDGDDEDESSWETIKVDEICGSNSGQLNYDHSEALHHLLLSYLRTLHAWNPYAFNSFFCDISYNQSWREDC